MSFELIVHTILHPSGDLTHNVQTDSRARTRNLRDRLVGLGYPLAIDVASQSGYHTIDVYSYEDRAYTRASRTAHSRLLKHLRVPANKIDSQSAQVISTYTRTRGSRARRERAPSPVRMR